MVGGTDFTPDDAKLLKEYYERRAGTFLTGSGKVGKPLKGMDESIEKLEAKKAQGFQFGATSISYIEEVFLRNKYGFKEPMVTNEVLKGQMCEEDSRRLSDEVLPVNGFRARCRRRITTDKYTGLCDNDLPLEDLIEDIKSSWSLKTFFGIKVPPELYYAQGQVYMKLYGRSRFRLIYCLVDTPDILIEQELKKYRYKFSLDGDYDNKHYQEIEDQMYHNHKVEHRIPAEERIKFFDFDRNDEYLAELDKRVELAQAVYESMKLNAVEKSKFAAAA